MAKVSKPIVDKHLRDMIFADLIETNDNKLYAYSKINERQYGGIWTDDNGVKRYCRIGVIVAEEREDMTAEELMQSEINKYNESVAKREEKKQKAAEKAAKDKAARKAASDNEQVR